jgi:hypothetical protein
MHDPASELRRILLLGTGVKIALAAAHFHGFGVAPQGPWITWMNKGESWSLSRGLVSRSCLLAERCNPLVTLGAYLGSQGKVSQRRWA